MLRGLRQNRHDLRMNSTRFITAAVLCAGALAGGLPFAPNALADGGNRPGHGLFNFSESRSIPASFQGDEKAIQALRSGQAEPRVLASGDLDGNATPDVVAGYTYGGTGIVTIQRGNPAAFAPTDQSVYERKARATTPTRCCLKLR
jgi:hypothetical protein